eukprot:scpid76211/ scgid22063/ 
MHIEGSGGRVLTSTIHQHQQQHIGDNHLASAGKADNDSVYLGSVCSGSHQLFPDSTFGSTTPDSGLEASFTDSNERCTPLSSQSSCGPQRLVPDHLYLYDNELDLTHCLIHLLMLASAISLALQRSEYMV